MLDAHPLVAVVGPTGSGKSELALHMAARFNGEIVNCDSVQVYAGLNIGSAKTPEAERGGIPHHLFDVIPPSSEMTAGEYARRAASVLQEIRGRGTLPVIAGGTGFYLRALLDGLPPAPQRNPELRDRLAALAKRRPAALHRFLKKRDGEAAARIHPNDHQKLIRAIEMSGYAREAPRGLQGFRILKIGLNPPREALYEKLNRRSAWMFENGLLAETQALLESGVPASARSLATLGYRQAVAVLAEEMSKESAVSDFQVRTRQYAKRQMTWFRAERDLHWLNGFGGAEAVRSEANELVNRHLLSHSTV